MNLRSVRIQNYRAIRDLQVDFRDELGRIRPVTVLAGPNGSGKTSAVFAILNAVRGVFGYRTVDVPEPTTLDIYTAETQAGWTTRRSEIAVDLQLHFGADEIEAIRQIRHEALASGAPSRSSEADEDETLDELPNGELRVVWRFPPGHHEDGSPKPWWWIAQTVPRYAVPWLYGRKEVIRLRSQKQLSDFKLLDRIGGLYLFPQDRSLKTRVMGDSAIRYADEAEANLGGGKDRPSVADRPIWGILEYLANYAHAERPEPLPDEENWELRVKSLFKRICGPREYAGFLWDPNRYPDGAPCLRGPSGAIYPLNLAASGEQVILEYITRLTYPRPMNHSLILIDEPEVHLHPGWSRQLYQALPEIGQGNQYVLTTHSAELRAMAADDNALIDLGQLEIPVS